MADNVGSIANIRKKAYKIHELISTSYHESGHVIYGLLHFMKIESVCVFEDSKSKRIAGFTHYYSAPLEDIKDNLLLFNRLYAEIGLSYAGLISEKRHFKIISGSDKFPLFLREGSSNDTLDAAGIIKKYNLAAPGKKRYDFKKKIIKEVNKELRDNWEDVILVSHELFKKNKLNLSDLKTLLFRKSKNKEFWKNQFKIINSFYDHNFDEQELKELLSI